MSTCRFIEAMRSYKEACATQLAVVRDALGVPTETTETLSQIVGAIHDLRRRAGDSLPFASECVDAVRSWENRNHK